MDKLQFGVVFVSILATLVKCQQEPLYRCSNELVYFVLPTDSNVEKWNNCTEIGLIDAGESDWTCIPDQDEIHKSCGKKETPEHTGRQQRENQSPVQIKECTIKSFPPLLLQGHGQFRLKGFTMKNVHNAHISYNGIKLPILSGGPLTGDYIFKEAHFHWGSTDIDGSEHTMDGQNFASELHLVHYNKNYEKFEDAKNKPDGVAVVAIWFKLSPFPNLALSPVIRGFSKVQKYGCETKIQNPLAMSWLLKFAKESSFYTYSGSFTTPEFNEGVTWIILKHTLYISSQQVQQFRGLINSEGNRVVDNRRSVQDLGTRTIFCTP